MRWRIKHKDTGLFLADSDRWTPVEEKAMTFPSAITLTDFIQKPGMREQIRQLDFIQRPSAIAKEDQTPRATTF